MSQDFVLGERLPVLVDRMVASYRAEERSHHIGRVRLPSRSDIIRATEMLVELIYPGYFGRQNLSWHNVGYHVGELLPKTAEILAAQIRDALCHQEEVEGKAAASASECAERALRVTDAFLERLPDLRQMLAADVQAAYDGDPAATGLDEVILAYPGVLAVTVHRIAHELHALGVPLIPRIMTEWAHTQTGVDIHPGATIGRSFFIDHATGVVIGETAVIGDHVKIYQGVTLGALSIARDERGRVIRASKRHPTVKDGVTLYANAIVLGGETTIGTESVVGGSVFLTSSVPDHCVVSLEAPELKVQKRRPGAAGA